MPNSRKLKLMLKYFLPDLVGPCSHRRPRRRRRHRSRPHLPGWLRTGDPQTDLDASCFGIRSWTDLIRRNPRFEFPFLEPFSGINQIKLHLLSLTGPYLELLRFSTVYAENTHLHCKGKYHCTSDIYCITGLDSTEQVNLLLISMLAWNTDYKPVKQAVSHTYRDEVSCARQIKVTKTSFM